MRFSQIFPEQRALIGMVHVGALPGTPGYGGSMQGILDAALRDAAVLKAAGFDGILLENMHDAPYLKGEVGHEVSAAMAVVCMMVKRAFQLPTGVQVLAAANTAAMAVAHASGLDFIRAEGFVYGHVADEGWIDAQAGPLLRYRRAIGAEGVAVFADIKKKHAAHAATADVDIVETAAAVDFFGGDAVVVTGRSTGHPADLAELARLKGGVGLPVLVGSGVDAGNAELYAPYCAGMIVGSSIKLGGKWQHAVDGDAARALVDAVRGKWG